ncbi:MAG: aldose 1-epimerase [Bacteroidetes bacterium]|nr:aldose 1-epimerase [Bacteroidota bacterium]MBS1649784.1 aldose 1-epimerase [Bacteroidota bacterium]
MRFTVSVIDNSIINLTDTTNNCQAVIYSFGALLNEFSIEKNNKKINIIDGFHSVKDAKTNVSQAFKSSKLSPFVCRMKNGEYYFNNQLFKIEKFYLLTDAIHGLLYDASFSIITTHADNNCASVGLKYVYTATDKGYLFPYEIFVNWKLEANNNLSVATTLLHHNQQSIPIADGWHPYFSLSECIDDCMLQFDSAEQFEFDTTLIPTGKKIKDDRFIQGASLKNIELDNCFELANPGKSNCILKTKDMQLTIQPSSQYPFLQIYTPPHRKSIAIENLSALPNCFNNNIGLLLLEPEKQISFKTTYTIKLL